MRERNRILLLSFPVVAFGTTISSARADVQLHPLFTDHMVLQRATTIPVWGKADPGERVAVTLERRTPEYIEASVGEAVADSAGHWKAKLPLPASFGPYTMTVEGKNKITLSDVMLGEVWICSGQSNMEMKLRETYQPQPVIEDSANPMLRLFTVQRSAAGEPQWSVKSTGWHECGPKSVSNFSAVGYYFGRDLQKNLNIPVGLIHTSWGGTPAQAWTSREALDAVPDLKHYHERLARTAEDFKSGKLQANFEASLKKWEDDSAKAKAENKPVPRKPSPPGDPVKSSQSPSTLFNAMIAPLISFPVRGAIWYQGESNAGAAYEYRTLLPTMISDWRKQWGLDMPFLCVQLAPFMKIDKEPAESHWAELREAQWLTTEKLPGVGMAVITDVGDENDIHPGKKEPVGGRLALLARNIAYNQPVVANGPTYKSMQIDGNRVILNFDSVCSGLECRGDKLTGFAIAGDDRKFVNAQAEIHGNTVVVSAPGVDKPVAVRFGWANYPVVNLWNKDGLPATPFRTDDWPGRTWPKPAGR
jgi:sialate O-acetylesterase